MRTATNITVSKANQHLYADKIRKQRNDYVISNGVRVSSIHTPFGVKELYCTTH